MTTPYFDGVPEFCFGTPDEKTYNIGCGLADDLGGIETDEDSFMRICYGATAGDFDGFVKKLMKAFPDVSPRRHSDESGSYCEFDLPGSRSIYTYLVNHSGELRVIDDRSGSSITEFCGDVSPAAEEQPLIMQYGLYYDKMIRGVTCDCGMCYFIRLRDNRLVMIDGGEIEQCTAPAVKDVMRKMHALTNTKSGEKMIIAAWLCTHAHNDHMDLFTKLIKDYADEIEVQRVVFNFPSCSLMDQNECVQRMKQRVKQFAPDVRFLKAHTGQSFFFGGVKFEIMLTHEDIIQKKLGRLYDGMNGTTTVFRISANGKSFILLGDLQEEGANEIAARYGSETLTCEYLQAAHHCINSVESAYSSIKADRVLIPQAEIDCRTRNAHNFAVITKYNRDENCIFAGNGTDVFTFGGDADAIEHYPVEGCPYDGSDF